MRFLSWLVLCVGVSFSKAERALSLRSARDWKSDGVTISLWAKRMAAPDRSTMAIALLLICRELRISEGLILMRLALSLFGQVLHGQRINVAIVVSGSGFLGKLWPQERKDICLFPSLDKRGASKAKDYGDNGG